MKSSLVHRDGDRATARLTPSWVGRVLGARVVVVECLRRSDPSSAAGVEWVTEATRRVRAAAHRVRPG